MELKYKDKYTVVGTPDEVKQFIRDMEDEEPTPRPKVVKEDKPQGYDKFFAKKKIKPRSERNRNHTFSGLSKKKQEQIDKTIDYMIKHPDVKMTKAFLKATGKHLSDYGPILRKRARSKKFRDKFPNSSSSKAKTVKGPDKRTKRMSFISSRANSLMRQYNYTREKAWGIAAEEWHRGSSLLNGSKSSSESTIEITGKRDIDKLLIQMLGNVAKSKGELKYPRDANTVGINSIESWRNTVTKIFNKVGLISKELGIANKFKLYFIDSTPVIRYG